MEHLKPNHKIKVYHLILLLYYHFAYGNYYNKHRQYFVLLILTFLGALCKCKAEL